MSILIGAALAISLTAQGAGSSHLVIITGLGGEPGYRRALQEWAGSLTAAGVKLGLPAANIVHLAGDSGWALRATTSRLPSRAW